MTKVTRKSKAAAAAAQSRGGGGGGGGGGKGPKSAAAQVTAAQLYQQAQVALRFDDFDAAKDALRRAVKLEPRNSALVDAYACLLAELSDDGAKAALQQAVTVAPTSGHEKYFYLAQLEEDPATAIQCSSHGLALLQSHLQEANAKARAAGGAAKQKQRHQGEARALSKALCSALVSHAEMLLGLACSQREDALPPPPPPGSAQPPPDPRQHPLDAGLVTQVEAALSQARALQPHSPEPGQALAALRSEQGRSEEALAALRASMAFWWDAEGDEEEEEQGEEEGGAHAAGPSSMQQDERQQQEEEDAAGPSDMEAEEAPPASSSGRRASRERHARAAAAAPPAIPEGDEEGEDVEEEEEEDEEEEDVPSFEFRFECAKLLLELDESTDTAVGVLTALVEEYDSNPDAWHLLALALYSGHQYEAALETAVKGQELLRRLRVPKRDEHWASFAELVDAIKEAAGSAAAAAGAAGIKGSGF